MTFDAPDPQRPCTRRERSNTPLQALTLLNDPMFFGAAQALAARVLREAEGDSADRVDYVFRLCLARGPTPHEAERLAAYLREQTEILEDEPSMPARLSDSKRAGSVPVEAGAWVGLSSILLNLDEFITRE